MHSKYSLVVYIRILRTRTLRISFQSLMSVEDALVMRDKSRDNVSRGFAFVSFKTQEGMEKACAETIFRINESKGNLFFTLLLYKFTFLCCFII